MGRPVYYDGAFVVMSTKGRVQPDGPPCTENIQFLWKIHEAVAENATTSDGSKGYSDLCTPDLETERQGDCFAMSILRLWDNDPTVINGLSNEKISSDLTEELQNPE